MNIQNFYGKIKESTQRLKGRMNISLLIVQNSKCFTGPVIFHLISR